MAVWRVFILAMSDVGEGCLGETPHWIKGTSHTDLPGDTCRCATCCPLLGGVSGRVCQWETPHWVRERHTPERPDVHQVPVQSLPGPHHHRVGALPHRNRKVDHAFSLPGHRKGRHSKIYFLKSKKCRCQSKASWKEKKLLLPKLDWRCLFVSLTAVACHQKFPNGTLWFHTSGPFAKCLKRSGHWMSSGPRDTRVIPPVDAQGLSIGNRKAVLLM